MPSLDRISLPRFEYDPARVSERVRLSRSYLRYQPMSERSSARATSTSLPAPVRSWASTVPNSIRSAENPVITLQSGYRQQLREWELAAPAEEVEIRQRAARRIVTPLAFGATSFRLNDLGLTCLPPLPSTMTKLNASSNQLTALPEMPVTLRTLDVGNNCLTTLPTLPEALKSLYAGCNELTILPALPQSLRILRVSSNRLTALPALPTRLRELYTYDNQLTAPLARLLTPENCVAAVRQWQENNLRTLVRNAQDSTPPAAATSSARDPARVSEASTSAADLPFTEAEIAEATTLQNAFDSRLPRLSRNNRPPLTPRPLLLTRLPPIQGSPPTALAMQPAAGQAAQGTTTPLTPAAQPVLPCAARNGNWVFRSDNSADFNTFASRLRETAEYADPSSQPRLIARMSALVSGMRSAPALRDICFGIATQAIESCRDRIAQGLSDMERAKINHDVEVQNYPVDELFAIGEGLFKLKVVDDIADREIAAQHSAGVPLDEVEIRLAYQVGLRDRLDLPAVAESMAFSRMANLDPDALDAAEVLVRRRLEGRESVDFLVQWSPWQRALERDDTGAVYQRARTAQKEERDELVFLPARTTEGEWMAELSALKQRHADEIDRITLRMTRKFLAPAEDA